MKKKELNHFCFKGIKVNVINIAEIHQLVGDIITDKKKAYFCLTDAGNVILAQQDAQLASAINQSDLSIADGTPLTWFGRLTGWRHVQRISGVDLFQELLHHTDLKHFLLGDTVATHRDIIAKAKAAKPDIKIESYSPPFKERFSSGDNQTIMEEVKKRNPDIIWVSFGGGKQEKWMFENAAKLEHGIMIGVGAAFRFYIGELVIPPKAMQRLGLQWMSRLIKTPKRWLTQGPFKRLIIFTMNFPFEFLKARHFKHFNGLK